MDILNFYTNIDPRVSKTTINWRIQSLVKKQIIFRVGRGKYSIGKSKIFKTKVSHRAKIIYNKLEDEFPYLDKCIWETSIINELMQHQPGTFYMIIEIEKEAVKSVFHYLKELNYPVFLSTSGEDLENYLPKDKVALIVKPLTTESPTQKDNSITTVSLEKLLVDIYCDTVLFSAQQGSEMRTIFSNAFEKYTVNKDRLLRYANRKGKKEVLQYYLLSIQK